MNQDIVNGAFLFRVLLKVINKKGNVSFWIYKVYIQGVYKFGSIKMEALFYAYRSMSNPLLITSNFSMGGKTACLIYHQSKEPHPPQKKEILISSSHDFLYFKSWFSSVKCRKQNNLILHSTEENQNIVFLLVTSI
uniref:Uncharacterized protein n=1 Tax=Cacopsylla melanoneura TaxID=428564 RepID=A0A8D8RVV6_9HEMI